MASAAAAMLTIMVLLRSNQQLPVFRRRAGELPDHDQRAAVASMQIFKTRPECPMNAFQVSEIKSPQRPPREYLLGEQIFSALALSHFEVAVSSIVITLAAFLILPRHRAIRVAEPIANIAVGAVTAWHRPPAAAVLQGIIAARLKPRRHRAVRVALVVPLIEIVAVAARRRMAATSVPNFLDQDFLD
jgi:hypothetical protein